MAISVFSVPISNFRTDCDLDNLYNIVSNEKYKEPDNSLCHQSVDSALHLKSEYKSLVADIYDAVKYHNNDAGYEDVPMMITQMWSNKYIKGSSIHEHTHSNSFLSGVFIVSGSDKSATVFKNPLSRMRDAIQISRKVQNEYSSDHFFSESIPGQLTIFPSWLPHSTTLVESERYSISFNVIPKTLGTPEMLNYVKII